MRTEDSNNTHENLKKKLWGIRWCSATCDCIKNDSGCFLVVLEAAVSMCLIFLGKT